MNYLSNPPVLVPFTKDDGLPNEWMEFVAQFVALFNDMQRTGTTAQRPNPAPFIGYLHFDTTLNKPVWAKTGTVWIDATGAVV